MYISNSLENGNWSQWESWSPCSSVCNIGKRMKLRYCNDPSPANGTLQCEREDGNRSSFEVKQVVCNENKICLGEIFEHLTFISFRLFSSLISIIISHQHNNKCGSL